MKTLLFDLDGTLTDSGEGILRCAKGAYEALQLPVPEEAVLKTFIGPPLRNSFVQNGIPEELVEDAMRIFRARYESIGKFENFPYPGIEDVLRKLKAAGYTLYVATSKPEKTAEDVLAHFHLDSYFDLICGASMDLSRETKEAVIDYLMHRCGGAENCLMIGDTKFDVIGAKAFEIPTIGVSWGYGSREDMLAAGAVRVVDTMQELLEAIRS